MKCKFEGCQNEASKRWGYAGCEECFQKILRERRKR